MEFAKPWKYQARIITKDQLTQTVYFVRYELVKPDCILFRAGQTFMLTVAPGTHRAMSIASPPQETHILESVQDVAPMGIGSKWLLNRKVGDEVELTAPLGRFVFDHESVRKKVMIATGTGIAPFRSMLLDMTDNRIPNESIALYWGLRHEEDLFFREQLEKIDKDRDKLIFYLILSQPTAAWSGLSGHVQDHIFTKETDFIGCDYYLCGNKKMITDTKEKLFAQKVLESQIKYDPYY
jgi:NAD(P)H-flavin reductase